MYLMFSSSIIRAAILDPVVALIVPVARRLAHRILRMQASSMTAAIIRVTLIDPTVAPLVPAGLPLLPTGTVTVTATVTDVLFVSS